MKPLAVVASVALAVAAVGETRHFAVLANGRRVGTADLTQTIDRDGTKQMRLELRIGANTIVNRSSVDRLGQQVTEESTYNMGVSLASVRTTFSSNGTANVEIRRGRQLQHREFPFDRHNSRRDPSEFWFIRSRPTNGMWIQHDAFSADRLRWEHRRTVYAGRKSIQISGRTATAHLMTQTGPTGVVSLYVDDQGVPICIESGATRLERIW